ncbi:DUF4304 domain-containing protein [Janthinobacterium sp. BJB401]|uniref:DUF4304 domain-containing protein n=1 Tax=Janthinobacterium sp. BJB401 TaxID=2745934 RepID=UPI0015957477|nr:DUF4304 domain-containing protein [Janthinobacterium sp. BJB401]NVI81783.1 DUF4304 domain-containing protein [Janthinobacterium sp. BJB401]
MKPKALIIANIEEYLLEPLSAAGFKFSPGQLTFKRAQDEFVQAIHFQANRHNEEDVCAAFWSHYQVSSRACTSWHKARYGYEPVNNIVGEVADWNIKNWQFPVIDGKQDKEHQLVDPAHRATVMACLRDNLLQLAIPWLDHHSNWENAALALVEAHDSHARACDFYLMAGKQELALWALNEGIAYWERNPKASYPQEKEEIALRMEKYVHA